MTAGGRKPPPAAPPGTPMTPTRERLGSGRPAGGGVAAAPPAASQPEATTVPPDEGPESMAQPEVAASGAGEPNVASVDPARAEPAPPQPAAPSIADSTSRAASTGQPSESGMAGDPGVEITSPDKPADPVQPAPAARPAAAPAAQAGRAAAAPRPAGAGARPVSRPAPPPAEPEPEPDPAEVVALREVMPDLESKRVHGYIELQIPKERLLEIAQRLRDQLDYDYLSGITAVDWLDRIEMVYHLYSFNYLKRPTGIVLRVNVERPDLPDYPLCPSLTTLWPGADFQEREIYDLMGVKFVGHPDLRRILLADDFPGHPLRKDFVFDFEYVTVRHLAYGVEGQFAEPQYGARSPN